MAGLIAMELDLLLPGAAQGPLLRLGAPLSFWGGLDAATGRIIDRQHPQHGLDIAGTVLALPATRGSTAAPGALLACLAAGRGPVAIVIREGPATPLAALLAGRLAGVAPIPLARLVPASAWDELPATGRAAIRGTRLVVTPLRAPGGPPGAG